MIIETTSYPEQSKRMFYGLTQKGRPFFRNKTNNEETPYYSINITDENNKKLEAIGAIVKLSDNNNNEKEYYLSISKLKGNAELFDFDNDIAYCKTVEEFKSTISIKSLRHTFLYLSNSDLNYYYLFGFITYDYIYLQKHIFKNISYFKEISSYTNEGVQELDQFGFEISCFQTERGLIICFF